MAYSSPAGLHRAKLPTTHPPAAYTVMFVGIPAMQHLSDSSTALYTFAPTNLLSMALPVIVQQLLWPMTTYSSAIELREV